MQRTEGYFTNWANLVNYQLGETQNKPIKPTIQCRLHACCLDSDELRHWIDLLFAIIRVAEAKAQQMTKFNSQDAVDPDATFAEREGNKCRINDRWHRGTAEESCGPELLGLDAAETEYWKSRYGLYKRDVESPRWMYCRLRPDEDSHDNGGMKILDLSHITTSTRSLRLDL